MVHDWRRRSDAKGRDPAPAAALAAPTAELPDLIADINFPPFKREGINPLNLPAPIREGLIPPIEVKKYLADLNPLARDEAPRIEPDLKALGIIFLNQDLIPSLVKAEPTIL